MADWTAVTLTEARQVLEMIGGIEDEDALPPPEVTVRAHYDALRRAGPTAEAVTFLGQALPRFEAVAWGARILDEESRRVDLPRRDRQALDTTLRWLHDPDEAHRRAARAAADAAGRRSPECYLALAAFYSGGSIVDLDLPPTPPPPHASGRFVTGAVTQAAWRVPDAGRVFERALALGEQVAERGFVAAWPA
jgi:hypothetical protein